MFKFRRHFPPKSNTYFQTSLTMLIHLAKLLKAQQGSVNACMYSSSLTKTMLIIRGRSRETHTEWERERERDRVKKTAEERQRERQGQKERERARDRETQRESNLE